MKLQLMFLARATLCTVGTASSHDQYSVGIIVIIPNIPFSVCLILDLLLSHKMCFKVLSKKQL